MAPVLLCPDCGAKHPLGGVSGSSFPCTGCGRILKVPEQAKVAANGAPAPKPVVPQPSVPQPAVPLADATSTRVMAASPRVAEPVLPLDVPLDDAPAPPSARSARPAANGGRFDPMPARWIRFLLWFVALPLAFLIVFVLAKLIGVLNSNQVENVALDDGWSRFIPIARLLPFVALVTAALVHAGVYGIMRFRSSRRPAPPSPAPDTAARAAS